MQATVRYSREELLDIGKMHYELKYRLLDCDFLLRLDPTNTSRHDMAAPASREWRSQLTVHLRRRRGRRSGLQARLKARAT